MKPKKAARSKANEFGKLARRDYFYFYEWTRSRIEEECKRLHSSSELSQAEAGGLELVEWNLDDLRSDISIGNTEEAINAAIRVGMHWMAMQWGAALAGPGSDMDPAWDYIFKAKRMFPKKGPKEVIAIGMDRYEAASGKKAMHDLEFFQKKFSRMVKTHLNR